MLTLLQQSQAGHDAHRVSQRVLINTIKQKIKKGVLSSITRVWGDATGQVVLPTLSGPARNLRFKLDLNQFVEPLYFFGTYERAEASAVARICQPGWVVWDCGIYLGYYTTLFRRLVGPNGTVVAFEPDPRNVKRTRENLRLNKFDNVVFVEAAIGAPLGEIDFVISRNTNSHIAGAYIGVDYKDYEARERVDEVIRLPCISLDEAYQDPEIPIPQLIKIDIEGAELFALEHMEKIVTEIRPVIILELHNPECDAAAWNFFQKAKYSLESLDRGEPVRTRAEVGGTLLCLPNG